MAVKYWEPHTFEVGDRVRVLSRPECEYCRQDHDDEVGETGIVEEINRARSEHHPIWVRFDDPTITERTFSGTQFSHFAAIELEPLTDPAAQARGG